MKKDIFRKGLILAIIALFIASTHLSGTASTIDQTNKYPNTNISKLMLLRIDITQNLYTLPQGIEIVGEKPGEWIDIIIPVERLNEFSDFDYEVIIKDVHEYDNKVRGEYHTLAEIENILQDIANNYPDITSLYSIGKTYEERDILCLEITDNPEVDEDEPGVVFTGLHHAREWPSGEICLYIADQLTSQYGSNQTITDIVNNRRLWLVACVNPDGYHFDNPDDNHWRKNRRYLPEFESYGVDPNRNYGGSFDGNMQGAWGTITRSEIETLTSHNPKSDNYCGPKPFSEKESQAVAKIFLENNICASLNWHTYGEEVLWPWGYTSDGLTPDNSYLVNVGTQIAQKITQQDGSGTYDPRQAGNTYQNTGGLSDWSYGYGHYIQGRPTFSYTIEACSSFHPNENYLDQVCSENFNGAFYLLQEAENISKKVLPRVLPPVIDEMTYDSDGDYTVSWEVKNPEANPVCFQLDELTNLSCSIDDVDKGKRSLNWSYTTGNAVYSSPAVADGKVYVGSNDNWVYCLDSENGDEIWKYQTGDIVRSSPAVADGKVYFGSNDNWVYCLDAVNGDEIWKYSTYSYVRSSPAVADGKVYIGSGDNWVYCLDAVNGDEIWKKHIGESIRSSPAVDNNRVYVGSDDKKIYCLDADNGDIIWSYTTGRAVYSSPAVADGKVYAGSNDSNMYCFNADNGDFIWKFTTDNDVRSSPAVADGRVYFGSGDKKVYCLNAENGDEIWNFTTKGIVESSPAVVDDRVYIGSDDKNIYCFTKHGDLIWVNTTDGVVKSSPAVADDKVYVGSTDKKIYCYFPSGLWYFNGFKISNSRNHSENLSFYSGNKEYNVFSSSMWTYEPVPVTEGMELSFWCWYKIDSHDRAFVEVSRDGRCYDIIDYFYGSSGSWVYKNYSLDSYYGDFIFIRFRYTKDGDTKNEGFYVDDIMHNADFGSITTLSDSITSNQYNINGRPPGVYYYRVRGYNDNRGWGDFSALEGINVGTTPPNKPKIDGPSKGKTGTDYVYKFSADDPENHKVSYFIKWGDGSCNDWTDYAESETEVELEHTWTEERTYTIKAKAKDIYGAESGWAEFEVEIPRNKPFNFNYNLLSWLFERFPYLFPILRHILRFQ